MFGPTENAVYEIGGLAPEISHVSPQIAAPAGARTGFDRACPECPVKSRTGPITGFDRARTRI